MINRPKGPKLGIELASDNNFGNWELQRQNERCSLGLLSCGFAVSLPLTLGLSHSDGPFIRCGQSMCIRAPEKHTFHMLPISFEWLFPLVKVLRSLPPFRSHISSFLSSHLSFFTIRIAPTQGRPAIPSCSCAQNYHNSYNHFSTPPPPPPPLPDSFQDERCRK